MSAIVQIAVAQPVAQKPVAQQPVGSIRGVVRDKDFDAPLAGAQVVNVETGQKVSTADQGNYVFADVPAGRYTLVFQKDGYVRQVKADVVVSKGQLTDVDVALAGDFTDLEEYVVQDLLQVGGSSEAGLLQLRLDSPALMDSIGAELMMRANASDAASALKLVAGATVQNGKTAVIRGLPDRYVSSQMNGVRLPTADEDKRAVELDQFPSVIIDSIRVSKTFTPDQQGDASGGAVDVRLKGIPDEPFFVRVKAQTGVNTQVRGRDDFLGYDGGGLHYWGKDNGSRNLQEDHIGGDWTGAVGVSTTDAPLDYKYSWAVGGNQDIGDGIKIGGFGSFFYQRTSSFFDHGVDDSYWIETPGAVMTPKQFQRSAPDDFKTGLFDVTQGKQAVQWGGLATFGVATENHSINLLYLYTRTAEDTATLATDTRGKQHFFPGYDPNDPATPGHGSTDLAPYLRLETLNYVERTTGTLQLNGRHTMPMALGGSFGRPELDWVVARSTADSYQPDKRQFGEQWIPGRQIGPFVIPSAHLPFKPGANFTLGNAQRIFKSIEEDSDQYAVNLQLPFEQWSGSKGYLKFGLFHDQVDRTFNQDTFSNFNDNSSFEGPLGQPWSSAFPGETHPITESLFDVDYDARQRVAACYAMADLPLLESLDLIGGCRWESTRIGIENTAEANATWFPPGSLAPTQLNPGDADVSFEQRDVLPSIGLVFKPTDEVTLRASYNRTVARQTFKELTPILQQEFLGGPVFIGNPELQMSELRNYDLRADYAPWPGTLLSASWFRKDIKDPIEYVQQLATFDYTTAVNYPSGRLTGTEFEVRQGLGHYLDALDGLTLGANATFIHSKVSLPDDEIAGFSMPGIEAPMTSREMTNAPEHLYNFFATYDIAATSTQLALFYNVQGDSLVAGAGQSNGNFVPSVYALQSDSLNVSLSQKLGPWVVLSLAAKNLTNPDITTVYRSDYIDGDVTKTTYTRGIEYTLSIGGEIKF